MKTILITGINGFLGSSIAKRLTDKYKIVGTEYSLNNLFRISEFDFNVYGATQESYKSLFSENKIDIIIHTATFYGRGNEDMSQMLAANLISPLYLLNFAIQNSCELFINTDSALERDANIYSLTKKQFLDWLKFRSHEIKTVNMQLEHFYGPGANNTNFITAMITQLKKNEPIINLTKGEQRRDFVYYEDILDAYELIINSIDKLNEDFNHFEIGTGEIFSIKNLMNLLKELTSSKSELNFGAIPLRENELMESKPNNANILKLGWKPKTKIKEGLIKTIKGISG
ncbi:MAG: NAD(P)-dependent oxidoreductase [Bacteroidota bacterium]